MFVSVKIRKVSIVAVSIAVSMAVLAMIFLPQGVMATQQNGVSVPIIMYHSILKDESQWGDYVLSPVQLEKDIVYLKDNGYEAIFVSELIDYVYYGEPLPEKPVVLTFDDGDYNNLTYVLPLLEKYDYKATFSIVGKYTEISCEDAEPSPSYSYLDFKDISQLRKSGRVEIANHSYDMHELGDRRGACMKDGETYEQYRKDFLNDVFKTQDLLNERCGFEPECFSYPYGFICDASRHLVKSCGFNASLGVEERVNLIIEGDKDCLYDLCRFNRPSGLTSEEFMMRLEG